VVGVSFGVFVLVAGVVVSVRWEVVVVVVVVVVRVRAALREAAEEAWRL